MMLPAKSSTSKSNRFSVGRLFMSSSLNTASVATNSIKPVEYFRKDYLESPYLIPKLFLDFKLSASNTIVTAKSSVTVKTVSGKLPDLVLDGEDLDLQSVRINGVEVTQDHFVKTSTHLTIQSEVFYNKESKSYLDSFDLEIVVNVSPEKNLALSGLYKSGGSSLLSTQCEAMGFRRITYYLDRPDVLTRYVVRLEADKAAYPVLLSNGNLIDEGELNDGKHWALWEDPFPKPSYLFALVAGDLASIKSEYTTTSGRVVKLGIYSDKDNVSKLDHAMYSLKKSMQWDEDTFGLECDLDIYNVVATNDFNMGAM